jgi:hypothetical protein
MEQFNDDEKKVFKGLEKDYLENEASIEKHRKKYEEKLKYQNLYLRKKMDIYNRKNFMKEEDWIFLKSEKMNSEKMRDFVLYKSNDKFMDTFDRFYRDMASEQIERFLKLTRRECYLELI